MKKILPAIAALMCSMQLFAQSPQSGVPAGKAGFTGGNNGHIYGKIVDSLGKAIADASVIVLQTRYNAATKKSKEVLVKGVTTAGNGEFDIEDLPTAGKLKLEVSVTGFKELQQTISFMPQRPAGDSKTPAPGGAPSFDKDLGKIKLLIKENELKLDIDKKVFNVEKNIVSEGGTAVDVMKNVPSVNVDIDGNVTLRNSAPQILWMEDQPR